MGEIDMKMRLMADAVVFDTYAERGMYLLATTGLLA